MNKKTKGQEQGAGIENFMKVAEEEEPERETENVEEKNTEKEPEKTEERDINAKDGDGNTKLHDAAWKGDTETAKALIERGAEKSEEKWFEKGTEKTTDKQQEKEKWFEKGTEKTTDKQQEKSRSSEGLER